MNDTIDSNPAVEQPESRVPVRSRGDESPTYSDLPFWITACVRLAPPTGKTGKPLDGADRVFPVAQALLADRMRTANDEVELDRELVSRIAGYSATKRSQWIIDYLEHIGFLTVTKHYEPGTGRRSADTFDLSTRPPPNFIGPTTYAALADALRSDAPEAKKLFVDPNVAEQQNPSAKPRSAQAEVGSDPYYRPGGSRVQNPSAKPRSAQAEVGSDPYYRPGGSRVQNPSAKPRSAQAEVAEREREGTPSREFPPSIDRKTATPPAHDGAGGEPAQASDQAMTLVRRLPWPRGKRPSWKQAIHLGGEIDKAAEAARLTYPELHEHLADRVPRSHTNPMRYALGALEPDELPLPGIDEQDDRRSAAEQSAPAPPAASTPEPALPEWCGECGDGDPRAAQVVTLRRVPGGPQGRMMPCPSCHPDAICAA